MRWNWWADGLGPALVGLAEGAWVAVLYQLVETVGRGPTPIGLPLFIASAFVGALVGGRLEHTGAPHWREIAVAVIGLSAAGMLADPGVVAALAAMDPGGALRAHPAGWLLGVAGFRGLLGGRAITDADQAGMPFARGVAVLTLGWLYAGLLPGPSQVAFRAAAVGPTVLFATAGIGAVVVRRVETVALPASIPWWRNRPWLATVTGGLVVLALVAVPVANALATVVPGIVGMAGFTELVALAVLVGWLILPRAAPPRPRGSALRGLAAVAVLAVIGAIAFVLLHPDTEPRSPPQQAAGVAQQADASSVGGVLIVVGLLVMIGLLALLAALRWRRHARHELAGDVRDDAAFEMERPSLGSLRRPWVRLRRGRIGGRPATAEAAYLATLDVLDPQRVLRRLAEETPAAHARRLHREGTGSLELDLLAADYELSHWGGRQLPPRETRRAIDRWRRIRQQVAKGVAAERAAEAFGDAGERSRPS